MDLQQCIDQFCEAVCPEAPNLFAAMGLENLLTTATELIQELRGDQTLVMQMRDYARLHYDGDLYEVFKMAVDKLPVIHDLRKEPSDLPDTDRQVCARTKNRQVDSAYYCYDENTWLELDQDGNPVYCPEIIEWQELPTWEDEK